MRWKNAVKVDKSIKPIHYKLRKAPELHVGERYYVSFGNHRAVPAKLIEIDTERPQVRVTVDTENGESYLYADELGNTPEEAVVNEVTF